MVSKYTGIEIEENYNVFGVSEYINKSYRQGYELVYDIHKNEIHLLQFCEIIARFSITNELDYENLIYTTNIEPIKCEF